MFTRFIILRFYEYSENAFVSFLALTPAPSQKLCTHLRQLFLTSTCGGRENPHGHMVAVMISSAFDNLAFSLTPTSLWRHLSAI